MKKVAAQIGGHEKCLLTKLAGTNWKVQIGRHELAGTTNLQKHKKSVKHFFSDPKS
jgi:hypothetical protein